MQHDGVIYLQTSSVTRTQPHVFVAPRGLWEGVSARPSLPAQRQGEGLSWARITAMGGKASIDWTTRRDLPTAARQRDQSPNSGGPQSQVQGTHRPQADGSASPEVGKGSKRAGRRAVACNKQKQTVSRALLSWAVSQGRQHLSSPLAKWPGQ